ncbi:DEAD/DEAH box helicase [Nitrincola alkalilacustris]|uniref:DEAD/DEAH box helicase n=1 Tax=Nitrincola alkalilacustris TaxID=1571224 RepID=UPI001F0F07D8|nr:DEAD/DEAH box helicase [Nitrincola alkalilacustris]
MSSFSSLQLCPELQYTLESLGYVEPTRIQSLAIPHALDGKDLLAEAQTGSGKTAAFALPLIEQLSRSPLASGERPVRGLILTPTRELAIQVADNTLAYGRELGIRVVSIYGGVRYEDQIRRLKRGADILVATPGRLIEMLLHQTVMLDKLETLVLDEADRMLDLGFIEDIRKVISFMPDKRQTLLFSATLGGSIATLAKELLHNPVRVSATPSNTTVSSIKQRAYYIDNKDKSDILCYLVDGCHWSQTLVFTRTKKRTDEVAAYLQREGISAASLHGDRTQRERNAALQAFVQGDVRVLVATDVAARGLDIESLPQVINYDLPNQPEAYVHRIGRTGRAGKSGLAISFVAPDERRFLADICSLIGKEIPLMGVPTIEKGKLVDGPLLSQIWTKKPSGSGAENQRSDGQSRKPTRQKKAGNPKQTPVSKRSGSAAGSKATSPDDKAKAEGNNAGRRSIFQR